MVFGRKRAEYCLRTLFRMSSAANPVSSANNSMRSLWHTNAIGDEIITYYILKKSHGKNGITLQQLILKSPTGKNCNCNLIIRAFRKFESVIRTLCLISYGERGEREREREREREIYIYICCRVKTWSKIWGFLSQSLVQGCVKTWSKIFFCLFFPNFIVFFGYLKKHK